jgi:ABC-type multidrug transport system ATPase subunit
MQLVIDSLTKTYPNGTKALNNVSLSIKPGLFGLLGPNGAGKSSLMRTIATLQAADSGSVRFGDLDVSKDPEGLKRQLGYLPQEFGVYPRIDAESLLDHFATLKGLTHKKERKEVVDYLLQKTNLYDVRKKNLGTYSGGMKQRFGIAQALVGNPKLIIVDEPTAGLDPAERTRFHNLLAEIGQDTVVILSTHIVEDVTNLCPDMAIVCKGEVLAQGSPADAIATLQGKVWRKAVTREQVADYKQRYHLISTQLRAAKLNLYIHHESDPGEGFVPVDVSLEEVYFYYVSTKMNVDTL